MDFNFEKKYWNNVYKIKGSNFCVCIHCGVEYTCNNKNGKAVKLHMQNVHNIVDQIDSKINVDELNCLLFKCLTFNNISTTILDSVEFRAFCNQLNYIVPRRQVYNEYLESKAEDVKNNLKRILKKKWVSLTIDGWKSQRCREYVNISCCYIDDYFKTKVYTLAVSEVEDECSHTISDLIEHVKSLYDINITSITSDNAANVIKSIKDINIPNIRCVVHTIQLSIKKALDELDKKSGEEDKDGNDIDEVIDEDKKKENIVKQTINKFVGLSKLLRTVVNRKKIENSVGTITNTRWNSLYLVLNSINDLKDKLTEFCTNSYTEYRNRLEQYEDKKRIGIININKPQKDPLYEYLQQINSANYIVLDYLVNILKPFYDITLLLEKRETNLGMAMLNIKKVIYELNTDIYPSKLNEYAENIKRNLTEKIKIINNETSIPLLCCLLDPRVKQFIKSTLLGFTAEEYREAKNTLENLIDYDDDNTLDIEDESINYNNDLDKYLKSTSIKRRRISNDKEVMNYLEYTEIFSTGEDLSKIWLTLKASFPRIFKIAKKYLACQPSSSESERIFSETGRVSNLNKCNISSEHIEMKVLISRNRDL